MNAAVATALHEVAQMMHEAASRPYTRLVAELRYHGNASHTQFWLEDDSGQSTRFELRNRMDEFRMLDALKRIENGLRTDHRPGFVRADFELARDGDFDFRVHGEAQLTRSLVEAVRRLWPEDARRLRLSATLDSYGRFEHRFEEIQADGRSHYLDWPMPMTGDFDGVTNVLADIWEFSGDKFRELSLELGRDGDDYALLLDGRPD